MTYTPTYAIMTPTHFDNCKRGQVDALHVAEAKEAAAMSFKYQMNVPMGKDDTGRTVYEWAVGNTEEQFFNSMGRLYAQREGYVAPEKAITPQIVIPTFDEYCDRWFEAFVLSKPKNTQNTYKSELKIWRTAFGDKLITAITPMDVQQVLGEHTDKTKRYLVNVLNILKQVLNMAVEDGLVSRNVANSKRVKPTGKDSDERRILTDEEMAHCINRLPEIDDRDVRLCAAIQIYTGLRPGEVLGLEWGDIDFEEGVMHIRRAVASHGQEGVIGSTKTRNGLRTITLLPQLANILRPYRGIGLIFASDGKPYTQRQREVLVARIEEAMDIGHLVPYTFRHSFATKAYECGSKLEPLSRWMGHSDETITLKYYVHDTQKMRGETGGIVSAEFEKLAASYKK